MAQFFFLRYCVQTFFWIIGCFLPRSIARYLLQMGRVGLPRLIITKATNLKIWILAAAARFFPRLRFALPSPFGAQAIDRWVVHSV